MKKVKDIFALVIAMVMILAMGTTALAVDITVSKDSKNIDPSAITYTYYKIFDATYTSNTTTDTTIAGTDGTQAKTEGFAYTIPATSPLLTISGGNASIDDVTGITLTLNGAGDAYSVEYEGQMTEDAAKAMATALQNKINTLTNTQKAALTSGTLTWNQASSAYKATGLDKGYYLIESDYNSTLVLATSDIQINEKNSYVTDKKELVNAADDSVQIGDIIPYKITVNVPAGSNQQIVITDTYEAGLTPQVAAATGEYAVDDTKSPSTAGQVYVTATVDSATNLTFAVSEPSSASGTAGHFTITLTDEQVTALAGKTIIFTYYAELNANATVVDRTVRPGHLANNNTVTLKYGNDYDTTTSTVGVTTQSITLTKYDGAVTSSERTPIAGAIFELRKGGEAVKLVKVSDIEYRVATPEEIAVATVTAFTDETTTMANNSITTNVRTVAGNDIIVKGLDGDVTYTWVETKAPSGYNPTTENKGVTPSKTSVVNTAIENNKGSVLPSTGGIGTTIFYVIGVLLVVGSGVAFVTRRRVNAE